MEEDKHTSHCDEIATSITIITCWIHNSGPSLTAETWHLHVVPLLVQQEKQSEQNDHWSLGVGGVTNMGQNTLGWLIVSNVRLCKMKPFPLVKMKAFSFNCITMWSTLTFYSFWITLFQEFWTARTLVWFNFLMQDKGVELILISKAINLWTDHWTQRFIQPINLRY